MLKTVTVAAIIAVLCVAAFAQTPAQKTTLEFDQQQLQWLGAAINELPKKIADPFLADLNRQVAEQKAKAEAAEKAKPKAEPEK